MLQDWVAEPKLTRSKLRFVALEGSEKTIWKVCELAAPVLGITETGFARRPNAKDRVNTATAAGFVILFTFCVMH
jgi:hypothetical protein